MSPDKAIMMVNQIATFFKTQPGEDQAQRIADHLNDFWEPRMRVQLAQIASNDDPRLDPLARAAIPFMRLPAA